MKAEELTLRMADNEAGYFGVALSNPGKPKPYRAQARRSGKMARLGAFATAEDAALHDRRAVAGGAEGSGGAGCSDSSPDCLALLCRPSFPSPATSRRL